MKYLFAFVLGLAAGACAFLTMMYLNPFSAVESVSPLAVTDQPILNLQYPAGQSEAVFFTSGGDSGRYQPRSADELWEPTIRDSAVRVVTVSDARGQPVGIGVKFSTDSEATRLLNSEALVDSAWHVFLPGRGSLFAAQTENYWAYLRDIVVKAEMSSAKSWRGNWNRVMTVGPNALGTGRILGGSGVFSGIEGEIVETLNASAYSASAGPVAMHGSLTIALPPDVNYRSADTQ